MTKTIKITSKREFLYNNFDDIWSERYKYVPASMAVKGITAAVIEFNTEMSTIINISIKATKSEKAKVKLTGDRESIDIFLNRLFAETVLLDPFDIKC